MTEESFSEDLIVRYLLGDLPEEELTAIEDRAFRDRQYLQNIVAVENDLIDEYVRGELTDSERRQFERRFLASAERRRKVEFARSLASVTTELAVIEKDARPARTPATVTWSSALGAFLRGLNPAAKVSLAAAALLIVIGSSWLIVDSMRLRAELQREQQSHEREQRALEEQIAGERARSEEMAASLERERQQSERSQELARELEREIEESATKPSQPPVASLTLWPGITRSGGARVRLALTETTRRVRLQIGIEPEDQYSRFRVELRAQGGQQVWAEDNLRARPIRGGRAVVLNLPARILKAGEYELTLEGVTDEGRTEEVGYYYFDVRKK